LDLVHVFAAFLALGLINRIPGLPARCRKRTACQTGAFPGNSTTTRT